MASNAYKSWGSSFQQRTAGKYGGYRPGFKFTDQRGRPVEPGSLSKEIAKSIVRDLVRKPSGRSSYSIQMPSNVYKSRAAPAVGDKARSIISNQYDYSRGGSYSSYGGSNYGTRGSTLGGN